MSSIEERLAALEAELKQLKSTPPSREGAWRCGWWTPSILLACGLILFSVRPGITREREVEASSPAVRRRVAALETRIAALESTLAKKSEQINSLQQGLGAEATARQQADAGLQQKVGPLEQVLAPFSLEPRAGGGADLYLTGVNLHIRNGLGATNGVPDQPSNSQVNGLGNLILGYNESRQGTGIPGADERSGSHNVVVGAMQNYSSYGGLVAGRANTISSAFATVTGGSQNRASGNFASVSGGSLNQATAPGSSVSGGFQNLAVQFNASVSGGAANYASGVSSSISGGYGLTSQFNQSWAAGGWHPRILENLAPPLPFFEGAFHTP